MQYIVNSPLGTLTITIVDNDITSIVFGEKPFDKFPDIIGTGRVKGNTALTKKIQKQMDEYFSGKLRVFDLPLSYQGTPFQMSVWKYVQTIPYGKVASYQKVAKAIGHPRSARAVGTACKRNPIPILIPCHRVITSTGKIGNYAGGKLRKEKLLKLEKDLSATVKVA